MAESQRGCTAAFGYAIRDVFRSRGAASSVYPGAGSHHQTPGRLLVTVSPASRKAFEILLGERATCIGEVVEAPRLQVTGLDGASVIDEDIYELKRAWQGPLRFEEVQ